jgi:type VI secretion system protein ImpG
LRQLGLQTLCTNRDLPLAMPVGVSTTDFTMESGAPVEAVRCLSGPTKPAPSFAAMGAETAGDITWRLISLMSLNYLSLLDKDEKLGAAALRELLRLYSGVGEVTIQKQIEGVRSVISQPIVRRIPARGPITYGRGLEVSVTFDDAAFEGTGMFLFGGVLEQFFTRYVSVNSFAETVVKSINRGEIMRWPARIGQRHTL